MTFDWREHDDDTVEYHFNPRLTIPDAMELLKGMPALAEAARQDLGGALDVRYGDRLKETLDAFPAQSDALGSPPPALIFIHGGYWRMMDKSDHSHVASDMVKDGVAHISLNYDLCPDVTLDDIVDEMRNAIIYIYSNAADLGVDENRLFLSGHSAGGQQVARMCAAGVLPEDVASRLGHVMPISPVADLRPLLKTSMNQQLGLDAAMAESESPVLQPAPSCKTTLWVGAEERPAFLDQARWLAEAWGAPLEIAPGAHHFDVIEPLADPASAMVARLLG